MDESTMVDDGPPNRNKVIRVINKYALDGLGEELERRWLGVNGDRESLRDLAETFNQAVLEAALKRAGEQPVDGEIQNYYRLLTADNVNAAARTQAETRLDRQGIDVESVKHDFISHQAIHTYLTDVRGASLPADGSSSEATITNRLEAMLRLRNRLVAVVERGLEALRRAGHLSLGDFDVMVELTVYCNECGSSMAITDLFDQGGCECHDATQ